MCFSHQPYTAQSHTAAYSHPPPNPAPRRKRILHFHWHPRLIALVLRGFVLSCMEMAMAANSVNTFIE